MNDNVPQNPMQPAIQGYRKFDQSTSDAINAVKDAGHKMEAMIDAAAAAGGDPRAIALARTNMQQGAMWLIRSIAKPEGFF
jgi:hypothetical protein